MDELKVGDILRWYEKSDNKLYLSAVVLLARKPTSVLVYVKILYSDSAFWTTGSTQFIYFNQANSEPCDIFRSELGRLIYG